MRNFLQLLIGYRHQAFSDYKCNTIKMQQVLLEFKLNCPHSLDRDRVSMLGFFSSGVFPGKLSLVSAHESEGY